MITIDYTTPKTEGMIAQLLWGNDKFIIGCEVCCELKNHQDTCDHPKNGYCALFRLKAAKDMIEFNMRGVNK